MKNARLKETLNFQFALFNLHFAMEQSDMAHPIKITPPLTDKDVEKLKAGDKDLITGGL